MIVGADPYGMGCTNATVFEGTFEQLSDASTDWEVAALLNQKVTQLFVKLSLKKLKLYKYIVCHYSRLSFSGTRWEPGAYHITNEHILVYYHRRQAPTLNYYALFLSRSRIIVVTWL